MVTDDSSETDDEDVSNDEWTRISPQIPTSAVDVGQFKSMLQGRYGKWKGVLGEEIGVAMDLLMFAYKHGYSAREVKELIKKDMVDGELRNEMKEIKFRLGAIESELVGQGERSDRDENER